MTDAFEMVYVRKEEEPVLAPRLSSVFEPVSPVAAEPAFDSRYGLLAPCVRTKSLTA